MKGNALHAIWAVFFGVILIVTMLMPQAKVVYVELNSKQYAKVD